MSHTSKTKKPIGLHLMETTLVSMGLWKCAGFYLLVRWAYKNGPENVKNIKFFNHS